MKTEALIDFTFNGIQNYGYIISKELANSIAHPYFWCSNYIVNSANIYNFKTHDFLYCMHKIIIQFATIMDMYEKRKQFKSGSVRFKKLCNIKFCKDSYNNLFYVYVPNFSSTQYKIFEKYFYDSNTKSVNAWFAENIETLIAMLTSDATYNHITFDPDKDTILSLIESYNTSTYTHSMIHNLIKQTSFDVLSRYNINDSGLLTLNECKQLIKYMKKDKVDFSDEQYKKLIGCENDPLTIAYIDSIKEEILNYREKQNKMLLEIQKEYEKLTSVNTENQSDDVKILLNKRKTIMDTYAALIQNKIKTLVEASKNS